MQTKNPRSPSAVFSMFSKVTLASHGNTSSSNLEVKCRTLILVRLISAQRHPRHKTLSVSYVLWKMPEMLLFSSHDNTGFSVFHSETKTQLTRSSANLKGLAKVMIMRSNPSHIHRQDRKMYQARNNLCNGTCSLTLSSHLERTFCWWQSSFGVRQVLTKMFSSMGHPGKRPRIKLGEILPLLRSQRSSFLDGETRHSTGLPSTWL